MMSCCCNQCIFTKNSLSFNSLFTKRVFFHRLATDQSVISFWKLLGFILRNLEYFETVYINVSLNTMILWHSFAILNSIPIFLMSFSVSIL